MNVKKILEKQRESIEMDKKTLESLDESTREIIEILENLIIKNKVNAEVFVGGSFAKGTLEKKDCYDVDIFVRFDWRLDNISKILEGLVTRAGKLLKYGLNKMHGSRDYFRLINKNLIFEIIPVYKIKKSEEARNVTDLSYFHVNYVRKNLIGNELGKEIMIAKKFFQARGVYGAESYINGFSGYGVECLIIYFRTFEKLLKFLNKIDVKERVIIDPGNYYKRKSDVFFELNESKIHGPIILVDPTWKERNVLAALNKETLKKLQESIEGFLKNPTKKFFKVEDDLESNLKKIKGEFLHINLGTEKQEGDIAGTKMKKFSRFLMMEISKYFEVLKSEFSYSCGQSANFYLIVKPKKEIIKFGPPIEMIENAKKFRKANKNVFEKNKKLYSRIKVDFSGRDFFKKFIKEEKSKMKEMGVSEMKIK